MPDSESHVPLYRVWLRFHGRSRGFAHGHLFTSPTGRRRLVLLTAGCPVPSLVLGMCILDVDISE